MAITAGVLSQVSVESNAVHLVATPANLGTGPYTYQWYYSTTTGFSPDGSNDIVGATGLTLDLEGLIPNTEYFFKVIAIDTGHSNDAVTYTQLAVVTTPASLSQNQFQQRATVGFVDLPYNTNTIAVQVDATETGILYPGDPVTFVDNAGGVPKVIRCTADDDVCYGFVNFNPKNASYVAGKMLEISQTENVIYLYATTAIARGAQVELDILNNGVAQAVPSSTNSIVGYAFDKAAGQGSLIRIKVLAPSFLVA